MLDADHLLDLDDDFSWRRAPVLLGDRLGVRPGSIIIGVFGVLAAGFGAWWGLRLPPPAIEEALPVVTEVPAIVSPSTTAPLILVLHIDGAVAQPGVHDVMAGSRVIDAVQAAGGLTSNADRSRINLAQLVADGQRIWVPAIGEEAPAAVLGEGSGVVESSIDGPIALSTASAARLDTLPGIGPSLASAIVDHREREGPFDDVDDLLDVAGIGPAKLDALRDHVQP